MATQEIISNGTVYVTGAVLFCVILIFAVINCVCGQNPPKPDQHQENGHVKRNKKEKKPSKKSRKQNGAVTGNEEINLQDQSRDRHSGNLSSASSNGESRPKSQHDGSRALPEIPDGGIGIDLNPYDGEEDSQTYAAVTGDDNLGGVEIGVGRSAAVGGAIVGAAGGTGSEYDPDYAGIGGGTDSASETYTMVKDTEDPVRTETKRKKASHPYAEVRHIGDAVYAQISEKPASSKRKTVTSTASSDTLETSPPVPEKSADLLESGSNRSSATAQANSPSLPPRNSILDNIPYADEGSPQHTQYSLATDPIHTSQTKGKKSDPPYDDITARESLSHIREREALEKVHVHSTKHARSKSDRYVVEREYDEIKSVPASSSSRHNDGNTISTTSQGGMPGDRNSLASDTYAEIGQNEPIMRNEGKHAPTPPPIDTLKQLSVHEPNHSGILRQRPASAYSNKSGTYTTVADIDITTPNHHQQTGTTSNSASSQLTPIYATPNKPSGSGDSGRGKNKKQRHTMFEKSTHSSTNMDTHAYENDPKRVLATEHVYSQVDKTHKTGGKNKKSASHGNKTGGAYDNVEEYNQRGARPKITTNNKDTNSNNTQNNDQTRFVVNAANALNSGRTPGYQTIGNVQEMSLDDAMDDPDYDTVQEGAVVLIGAGIADPYDVDYESLPGSAAAMATRSSNNPGTNNSTSGTSTAAAILQNGGTNINNGGDNNANPLTNPNRVSVDSNRNSGHEINTGDNSGAPSTGLIHVSQHVPQSRPYQRREHIYEVISDGTHTENIYTADPTRHVTTRRGQHQATSL